MYAKSQGARLIHPATANVRPCDAQALARACSALWTATLSLMAAFMHNGAPAHRYLIARKIARNLTTLHEQQECFTEETRATFAKLSRRWSDKADRLAPEEQRPRGGIGLMIPRWSGR
jgi:hypothetical protein